MHCLSPVSQRLPKVVPMAVQLRKGERYLNACPYPPPLRNTRLRTEAHARQHFIVPSQTGDEQVSGLSLGPEKHPLRSCKS